MSEQQHVAEAALAVVRPTTEPHIRASASTFLEQWTQTEGAWEIYALWLEHQLESSSQQSSRSNSQHDNGEHLSMQLLCLQLLQAKIRREVPRGSTTSNNKHMVVLERIHQCLARLIMATITAVNNNNPPALQPASICYAALSVRCGGLSHVVSQATTIVEQTAAATASSPSTSLAGMPPMVALRILSNVPLEVEACADLTTPQVTNELWPYLEKVLEACCQHMQQQQLQEQQQWEVAALATETLENWTKCCHVSLSQLNTPISNSNNHRNGQTAVAVLPVLVHLLSQPHYTDAQLPIKASRALTEAILVPTDACSDPRRVAVDALLNAINSGSGFLAAPLQYATAQGWEDACHALATVLCTLVVEEVDHVVTLPSEALLNLLLEVQHHPQLKVGCAVLECWLTVQDIPTGQRHEHWKAPLFQRVVERLVNRMAYPPQFASWEEELDVDQSEFDEFRRMVRDVLITSYFLLRVHFVRSMAQTLTITAATQQQPQQAPQPQPPWFVQEAALFALTVSSREVCARIKARGGGTSVGRDREETAQEVLALAQRLCGNGSSSNGGGAAVVVQELYHRHWLVLNGVCEWMGAYAAAWGAKCDAESIYQLLQFLGLAMKKTSNYSGNSNGHGKGNSGVVAASAAKALKLILVGCASKLVTEDASAPQRIPHQVKALMETILNSNPQQEEQVMVQTAEGCTRLVVQLPDDAAVQQSLAIIMTPLVQRCEAALQHVPQQQQQQSNDSTANVVVALPEHALEALEALNRYMRVMKCIIQFCERRESQQPATEMINIVWPFLESASQRLVTYEPMLGTILSIHEQLLKNMPLLVASRFDAVISYVVKIFEVSKDPSSLSYMASAVESYGSQQGLFDFGQLLGHVFGVLSPHLSSKPIVESCHVIAVFYQLCGRYLLYCPAAIAQNKTLLSNIVSLAVLCLTECQGEAESTRAALGFLTKVYSWRQLPLSDTAKAALHQHAEPLDHVMVGNGARLLQSCVDILVGGSQILYGASTDCVFAVVSSVVQQQQQGNFARQWLESVQTKPEHADVYGQVVLLLLALASEGPKNKAKVKLLLTDYSNICKGETSVDVLLSYSL